MPQARADHGGDQTNPFEPGGTIVGMQATRHRTAGA